MASRSHLGLPAVPFGRCWALMGIVWSCEICLFAYLVNDIHGLWPLVKREYSLKDKIRLLDLV